jgi:hypothetical protein
MVIASIDWASATEYWPRNTSTLHHLKLYLQGLESSQGNGRPTLKNWIKFVTGSPNLVRHWIDPHACLPAFCCC